MFDFFFPKKGEQNTPEHKTYGAENPPKKSEKKVEESNVHSDLRLDP